jgi:hypothetical protein
MNEFLNVLLAGVRKRRKAMDKTIRSHLDNIRSEDGQVQFKAYDHLMKEIE